MKSEAGAVKTVVVLFLGSLIVLPSGAYVATRGAHSNTADAPPSCCPEEAEDEKKESSEPDCCSLNTGRKAIAPVEGVADASERKLSCCGSTIDGKLVVSPPAHHVPVLGPGKLVAVRSPTHVPADQAKISPEAWVVGVALHGQARAYSLNLLNRHAVVNETIGETPFALAWCPISNTALALAREVNGTLVDFQASGGVLHGVLAFRDAQGANWWSLLEGKALTGPSTGTELARLPITRRLRYQDWLALHPDTQVWSDAGQEDTDQNHYRDYHLSPEGFLEFRATDERLSSKTLVYGLLVGERRLAVEASACEEGAAFALGEDLHLFLYRSAKADPYESSLGFLSRSGFEQRDGTWVEIDTGATFSPESGVWTAEGEGTLPEPAAGSDTYWFTWSLTYPQTELLR